MQCSSPMRMQKSAGESDSPTQQWGQTRPISLPVLAETLNSGTPMVCVIGNTHRDHSWKNMTQEIRQVDALRPLCKELIRIESIRRVPELTRRAFAVARQDVPARSSWTFS